jgi:hypothetical protein
LISPVLLFRPNGGIVSAAGAALVIVPNCGSGSK